ncbi:hypothetical protein WB91_23080 [bacteria symbiont BFo1 of Frankliniella occidentalis]|nr:hypothetical protein WB91_23080 [bacteria symbiont BFo1 of Frankliniella occidentalis]
MQPSDFNNLFIREVANKVRESQNLMFMLTLTAEKNDKSGTINESGRRAMGWPAHITNWYQYRKMWNVDYNRLYHMCLISHCSELEFFFKVLFDKYPHLPEQKNNFYQKFGMVIKELEASGIDFTSVQADINQIKIAFQVRHIGIHNMSIVDEEFQRNTNGLGASGTPGQPYVVDQALVRKTSEATNKVLKHLDVNLPPLPA